MKEPSEIIASVVTMTFSGLFCEASPTQKTLEFSRGPGDFEPVVAEVKARDSKDVVALNHHHQPQTTPLQEFQPAQT